ncbi:MAG: hypothetical protein KGJ70_04120 [Gemmatimonadota bacterium]|nr:hypothetical protein [Gemmatimonadota bacterium]
MPRRLSSLAIRAGAALRGVCVGLVVLAPAVASAQTDWNSPRTMAVVRTAIERRAQQLADTGLLSYEAVAHGYLTFLVQLGRGFPTPPKIVRTDQLALQVYWQAPDLSKQRIIGRRDTLLLPTDIYYHRDHLAIVQNNFPNVIRIGEGDEVRDAPHPLSENGPRLYDYAIADSLRITIPGQTFDVYEVKVRPKDDTQPRVVGAVYLDRRTGQVVRMAFSFTRAALIDADLEDISIVLENGLIGTKYWLPRHQEIEIRRTGTWFDYPVRGIIRGRWEISGYKVNETIPVQTFAGGEYATASPSELKAYPWRGNILDSLPPGVAVTTDADVRRVQAEARALVRERALQRADELRLAAGGLSDVVHVNRVQGLAVGVGFERQLGARASLGIRPEYGIADGRLRGTASLAFGGPTGPTLRLTVGRRLVDARLEPERSGIVNSLAAQEFGSDATEPYEATSAGAALEFPAWGLRWTAGAAAESQRAVAVHAQPALGRYASTIPATDYDLWHGSIAAARDAPLDLLGFDVTGSVRADGRAEIGVYAAPVAALAPCPIPPANSWGLSALADVRRDVAGAQFVARTAAQVTGATRGAEPAQDMVYFGGPVTAPGYALHGLVGTRGVSQRVELRLPVPFVSIPLNTFGRSPARATLAPYFNVVGLDGSSAVQTLAPGVTREQRLFPSVGVGLIGFFDLIRLDVARGLASGGRWSFSIDATRSFWPIL